MKQSARGFRIAVITGLTGSLVAMEADTPAEKAYLQMLASRLGLEPSLVEEIHRAAAAAPPR